MKLDKITLENFRCFNHLTVELHPQMTILVANNGQGKSAILDAIRIALWPYVSQFDLARTPYADPANTITIDDVRTSKTTQQSSKTFGVLDRMVRNLPSTITATGEYHGEQTSWQRFRDSEAKKSQTKDDPGGKQLKNTVKQLQYKVRDLTQPAIDLPIFGYYGTGRLWREKRLTDGKKGNTEKNNEQIRTFAYRDCLDPASSFKQFEDWFTSAYIQIMQSQIEQIELGETFLTVDPQLKCPVKVVQDAVNAVLKPVNWQQLQYSETYDRSLVLKHPELGVMKVSQLSDGIKNMLAMIADIAYRCVLLNGHFGEDAAKRSAGIVMIDEIDMHLHPLWQQTVIGSLQEAFPNIQFIVTTHSPQVLSTVPPECIRIIDENKLYAAPLGSKGAESSRLLKRIFGVDPRPPEDDNTKLLLAYERLVYADQWQSDEAIRQRQKLNALFADEEPKLTELDLYIENRLWELELEKDQ